MSMLKGGGMFMAMLKTLIPRPDGHKSLETPKHEDAHFLLQYGNLIIGRLWLNEGVWHFEYSDDFKKQEAIKPLTDFPHIGKHYVSDQLWPFFLIRIPSTQQPTVRRVIKNEQLDERNEAQLLRRFGRKTISNPFCLEAA
jgi:HipA-like protein